MKSGLFIFGIIAGIGFMCGVVLVFDPAVYLVEKVAAAIVLGTLAFGICRCYGILKREEA